MYSPRCTPRGAWLVTALLAAITVPAFAAGVTSARKESDGVTFQLDSGLLVLGLNLRELQPFLLLDVLGGVSFIQPLDRGVHQSLQAIREGRAFERRGLLLVN